MVNYESDKARYWRACDVWTLGEIKFLLNGEWPDSTREPPTSLNMTLLELPVEIIHDLGDGEVLIEHTTECHVYEPVPFCVRLVQLIEDAITAGSLTPLPPHDSPKYKRDFEPRFRPGEVVVWATARGCFPDFHFDLEQQPDTQPQAVPVVEVPAVPGTATIWTDARKAEAKIYRKKHGLKKTAEHYQVSQATISKHIPAGKPQKNPLGAWGGLAKK